MYARTMSPFSASIFLRSRRGWIVIRSQELWRRCVGLRLIASLLSQGRHFAKPRDISRVLVGNRLEPILEDHRWAHRSSRSHLTMIENVKLLRRRSHPTRPRIIQNGPDPRGATRNRDRPAGGVGCTNRLPPRPWDRTTEPERADLFFVQRNAAQPPVDLPGLPYFKLTLFSAPRAGKEAVNVKARAREQPHHCITELVGLRIDQCGIRHVVP